MTAPPPDAGSASGLLTTSQQPGRAAIGVAVAGVAFFSLLSGTASKAAAGATIPALRAQLAAHLPAPAISRPIGGFARCFDAQASSSSPACPWLPGVSHPAGAAATALARPAGQQPPATFVTSTGRVLYIQAGIWLLTGLLAAFLPRARREPAE